MSKMFEYRHPQPHHWKEVGIAFLLWFIGALISTAITPFTNQRFDGLPNTCCF